MDTRPLINTIGRATKDTVIQPGETQWIRCEIDDPIDTLHKSQTYMVTEYQNSIRPLLNETDVDLMINDDDDYEYLLHPDRELTDHKEREEWNDKSYYTLNARPGG